MESSFRFGTPVTVDVRDDATGKIVDSVKVLNKDIWNWILSYSDQKVLANHSIILVAPNGRFLVINFESKEKFREEFNASSYQLGLGQI